MDDPAPQHDASPGYLPPPFTVRHVDITLELLEDQALVTSRLWYERVDENAKALWLDGVGLTLRSLRLDGEPWPPHRFELSATGLRILDPPPAGILTIEHSARVGGPGDEGLIRLGQAFITHCEPQGFRRITFFPDRPDIKATYRCALIAAPELGPDLLANGEQVLNERLPDGRHRVVWRDDQPKSSYLFALAAGAFETLTETFQSASGRRVVVTVHAAAADLDYCRHGLNTLLAAMAWDEQTNGLTYGRDTLNVVVLRDYPGGAMENSGLNLYATEFFLADPRISTDEQIRKVTGTIAHEYFHEWSGNRVGLRSWLDLTVKEGLTVYRQQCFMADQIGPAARIDDLSHLRAAQYPEEDGGLAHPVRPQAEGAASNLFTRTVYDKGAELIRLLAAWCGQAPFTTALGDYFKMFDGKASSVEQFIAHIEGATGADLMPLRRWWCDVGARELSIAWRSVDGAGRYELSLTQAARAKDDAEPLPIPITFGLITPGGPASFRIDDGAEVFEAMVALDRERLDLRIETSAPHAVPAVLRQATAPVRQTSTLSADVLSQIVLYETDPACRWNAAQSLARSAILQTTATDCKSALAWCDLIGDLVRPLRGDLGVLGRLIRLPALHDIAVGLQEIDVEQLQRGQTLAARTVGQVLAEELWALQQGLSVSAQDISKPEVRGLRNQALWYLAKAGDARIAPLLQRQLIECATLEDGAFALTQLLEEGAAVREQALRTAYMAWRSCPFRLDHWFAVQAQDQSAGAPSRIARLLAHRDFDLLEASRVKALLDNFMVNLTGLHARDGAGYQLLTEAIAALDGVNPRLGSRFLKAFNPWRKFDPERISLMRSALVDLSGRARSSEVRDRLSQILT